MATTAWQDEITGAFDEIREASQPGTAGQFTWKGVAVSCTSTPHRRGHTLTEGGFTDEVAVILLTRLSSFLTADDTLTTVDSELWTADLDMPRPVAGKQIGFKGRSCRVVFTRVYPSDSMVEIGLDDAKR